MADRVCAKCGEEFDFPSRLRRHQRRKTPCSPIVGSGDLPPEDLGKKHACRFCRRRFAAPSGLANHVRTACKITRTPGGMELLYLHTLERHNEEQRLRREAEARSREAEERSRASEARLSELERRIARVSVSVTNVVNVNGDVRINVFGGEQMDHLNADRIRAVLDKTLTRAVSNISQQALEAVLEAAMLIYSDPDHPENITCYIPNQKQDQALVHMSRGGGAPQWEVQPCPLVLSPMATTALDLLFSKQPFEDHDRYGRLMQELRAAEPTFADGEKLRPILVRNKGLLLAISEGARSKNGGRAPLNEAVAEELG